MVESTESGVNQFVEIDGVRLEVTTWGDGPIPILMLHEGLGSVGMWRDFPALLSKKTNRRVIAWSRRGYGRSDRLQAAHEPDYMHSEADAAIRLMDLLAIERAVLFGHSDGGSISLISAARRPERVSGLILEAPHVFVEDITVESIAKIKEIYHETNLGEKLGRYHDDADHAFWSWNNIWLDPRFRSWSIEEMLPNVVAPTLLIQGIEDEYGTFDQLDRIERLSPAQVKRIELSPCGHSPHRDQPEKVLGAVDEFFTEGDL